MIPHPPLEAISWQGSKYRPSLIWLDWIVSLWLGSGQFRYLSYNFTTFSIDSLLTSLELIDLANFLKQLIWLKWVLDMTQLRHKLSSFIDKIPFFVACWALCQQQNLWWWSGFSVCNISSGGLAFLVETSPAVLHSDKP